MDILWKIPVLMFWIFCVIVWCAITLIALPFILVAFMIDEFRK